MALEIECKIYISNATEIQRILAQRAIRVKPRVFEQNVLYDTPDREFATNDIVLRLRQDEQTRLTYKGPMTVGANGIRQRLELETSVGDFSILDAILRHLGFARGMTYEKYRTTYQWPTLPDAEIVLDELPFGNFLEIEGVPTTIETILADLGLGAVPIIPRSYIALFKRVCEHYQLPFTDLTFANFAGCEIDPAIFHES
ncbi:MAG: class IV adenylate cyclase [Anaerolineales bacterium]|nr:class IV adenylate cyclase [Anaerolineales bacterium]